MKSSLDENETQPQTPPDSQPPGKRRKFDLPKGLAWLTSGLASFFLLALAVQLVRGKLWLVGPAGVWLLLGATLLAAFAKALVDNPQRVKAIRTGLPEWRVSPYAVSVGLLTGFGLWLRVWGQKNGLPYIIPADESLMMDVGTRLLKTGDFDPQMYYYPSLYPYIQSFVAVLHFIWGSFSGLYNSLADLPDRTYAITTAPQAYIWGRTVSALIGAAAIPLAYLAVKRMWGDRRVGVLAAGLVACSALAIEHSHYVAVDMPLATLALAALLPAWNIVEKGRKRDYLLTGLLVGLACSMKWNGLLVIVLPLTAHLLRVLKTRPVGEMPLMAVLRRYLTPPLGLSVLCTGLALLATTPYLLARLKGYSDAFGANLIKYRNSEAEYATDYPWLGNLAAIWEDSAALFVLGVGGVLLLAFRRRWADLLVLSFPLVYLLSINGYRLIYQRNVLPLTVYVAILAALFAVWAFDELWARLKSRLSRFELKSKGGWLAGLGLPLLVVGAVMFAPIRVSFYANEFNDQPFSYARVEEWLKREAGPGPLKLVEMRPQQWGAYPNLLTRVAEQGANDFSLEYYRERGIQFLAINHDRVKGANEAGSYPQLLQPALEAARFETRGADRPGPPFSVVRTGVTPATLKLQHPLTAQFGGKIRLLGLNAGVLEQLNRVYLPPEGEARPLNTWPTLKPGAILGLSVYWQVLAPLEQDYVVFIHLRPVNQPDLNAASRDTGPLLGQYPTSRWRVGEILTDNPNLALPPTLPPGEYNLVMGLYLSDGKFTPLPLADEAASLTLGRLRVAR